MQGSYYMHVYLQHDLSRPISMGQGLLLHKGEAFVLQHRQKIGEGNAFKFAAVAALAEPAALLGAKVQVAGKFGVVGAVVDSD